MVSNKFIMCACMFFIWKQIDYQKSESKPTVARADSKQAKMQTFDISYLEWTKKVSCMITPNQNQPTFTILHSLEEICMTCREVVSPLIHRFGKYYWVMHTPHSTRSCGFRFPVDEHKRFRKWAHEQNNHKKHARECTWRFSKWHPGVRFYNFIVKCCESEGHLPVITTGNCEIAAS